MENKAETRNTFPDNSLCILKLGDLYYFNKKLNKFSNLFFQGKVSLDPEIDVEQRKGQEEDKIG